MYFHHQLQVVGIRLKESRLLAEISDQRRMVRATSCSSCGSQEGAHVNTYSDDPNEETRGGFQAGRKVKDYLMLVLLGCQCTSLSIQISPYNATRTYSNLHTITQNIARIPST